MKWIKVNHNTNNPIIPNSGWHICDYVCGEYRIINNDGNWILTKNGITVNQYKTLKAAKMAAIN